MIGKGFLTLKCENNGKNLIQLNLNVEHKLAASLKFLLVQKFGEIFITSECYSCFLWSLLLLLFSLLL